MKQRTLLLILSLLTTFASGQKPTFNIKYSELLTTYVFVKSLTVGYGNNPFKTEFEKSKYFTEKYQRLISQFDTLRVNYTYQFSEYPYGSKMRGMTESILKKNLIASSNLTDFKLRSIGLIPNSSLSQLTNILSEFIPIYNELIYLPNKSKFEIQLTAISNFTITENIPGYFETGLNFYNSTWDSSIPFEIAFYPLPNSEGFTAEAFLNNAVSAIQTDLADFNVLLSVMLHEIFHILYDEQSLKVKNEIDVHFKENSSKCSSYAYLLLNEVLATALGNGYVFENLNKKLDAGAWYNWRYIDLMAKQIYPLILDYIKERKAIDKNFIDAYIKLYEQNYSNWINEPDHVMTYRFVLSENRQDFKLFRTLYPYNSDSEAETPVSEAGIERLKETPLTKIIVVSKNHAIQLSLIKRKFPELKAWKYKADEEFNFNIFLNDKTQLYIINQHETPTDVLIKRLGQPKK